VLVSHGANVFTLYAHLSKVQVRNGCVERGQRIGLAGSSGSVGLPTHLHFDVLHQVADVDAVFLADVVAQLGEHLGGGDVLLLHG
jgi:murein DD-endopeptidase MepM/ murein hydrolase activator NlpD